MKKANQLKTQSSAKSHKGESHKGEAQHVMREFVWNIAQSLPQPTASATPVRRTGVRRKNATAK